MSEGRTAHRYRSEGWDYLLVAVAEQARSDIRTSMTHEHTARGEFHATRHHHDEGNQPHDHGKPGRYRGPATPDQCSTGDDHPWPFARPHKLIQRGSKERKRSTCEGCSWEARPLMDPAWNGETHNVLECAQELLAYLETQHEAGVDPMDALFKVVVS